MYDHNRFMDRMKPIIEDIDPRVNRAGEQIRQVVTDEILSKIPWPSVDLYERADKCWYVCHGDEWLNRLAQNRKERVSFPPIFWQLNQILVFLECYHLLKRVGFREFAHLPERVMAFVICESLAPTKYALTREGMLITWHHDEKTGIDDFCPIEEKHLSRTWYVLYPEIWETFGVYLSAARELRMGSPAELDKVEEALAAIYTEFDKATNQPRQRTAQNG